MGKDNSLTAFYTDIRDSFRLAMQTAGVAPAIRKEILDTVDDYVDNEYSEE